MVSNNTQTDSLVLYDLYRQVAVPNANVRLFTEQELSSLYSRYGLEPHSGRDTAYDDPLMDHYVSSSVNPQNDFSDLINDNIMSRDDLLERFGTVRGHRAGIIFHDEAAALSAADIEICLSQSCRLITNTEAIHEVEDDNDDELMAVIMGGNNGN